jgi:hypothetical protein
MDGALLALLSTPHPCIGHRINLGLDSLLPRLVLS